MIYLYRSVLLSISVILLHLYCSPSPYGFSVNQLYCREKFSGSDLYGRSIGICPLLRDTAYDTLQFLRSQNQFEELKKNRSDLQLISADEIEKNFLNKWGMDSLQEFFNLLFRGKIASLQTRDSLWSGVKSDYYLVMRLKDASTVKTFNNAVRKRVSLEAELWDCKDQEVLWRTEVKGICISGKIPDSRFLMEAVKNVCEKLPAPLPSYGNQW
jgi:hypothetical protein